MLHCVASTLRRPVYSHKLAQACTYCAAHTSTYCATHKLARTVPGTHISLRVQCRTKTHTSLHIQCRTKTHKHLLCRTKTHKHLLCRTNKHTSLHVLCRTKTHMHTTLPNPTQARCAAPLHAHMCALRCAGQAGRPLQRPACGRFLLAGSRNHACARVSVRCVVRLPGLACMTEVQSQYAGCPWGCGATHFCPCTCSVHRAWRCRLVHQLRALSSLPGPPTPCPFLAAWSSTPRPFPATSMPLSTMHSWQQQAGPGWRGAPLPCVLCLCAPDPAPALSLRARKHHGLSPFLV